ncbi:MAG: type II toxin-antitoxin system PemK/MazF family toxin [Myxococcota bacterium]
MGEPRAGSVVLIRFPFSDLSRAKLRPALVLARIDHGDLVLAQITRNPYSDAHAVEVTGADFLSGSLPHTSYVRPGKLFTADARILDGVAGVLASDRLAEVVDAIVDILSRGST